MIAGKTGDTMIAIENKDRVIEVVLFLGLLNKIADTVIHKAE